MATSPTTKTVPADVGDPPVEISSLVGTRGTREYVRAAPRRKDSST